MSFFRVPAALILLAAVPAASPAQDSRAAHDHYEAARRLAAAGEVEEATEAFRRAIAADPAEWRYSYMLGEHLLGRTRRWDEARQAYEDAWAKGYRRGVTRHKIGLCLWRSGREEDALPEFERAAAISRAALEAEPPDTALLRFQLVDSQLWAALLHGRRRSYDEAYRRLHEGLHLRPPPHQDREVRGTALKVGHIAFGDADYDGAERFYGLALLDVDANAPLRGLAWDDFPDWRIATDNLLEVVARRRRLGAIQPEYTHRVLALVIRDQDVEVEVGGRRERVHRTINDQQRREAELRLRWLRQVLESLSDGRYSLAWELVDDTTRYRYEGDTRPAWVGDRRIIAERVDDFDTLLRLWPYGEGHGTGGGSRLSLAPYSDRTVLRGVMNVHPEHSAGLWLHEFFHVVEAMAGIHPTHGYYDEARGRFPGWTGRTNDQLDYFRWHFRTTLPGVGWERLGFRMRDPAGEGTRP